MHFTLRLAKTAPWQCLLVVLLNVYIAWVSESIWELPSDSDSGCHCQKYKHERHTQAQAGSLSGDFKRATASDSGTRLPAACSTRLLVVTSTSLALACDAPQYNWQ